MTHALPGRDIPSGSLPITFQIQDAKQILGLQNRLVNPCTLIYGVGHKYCTISVFDVMMYPKRHVVEWQHL